MLVLFDGPCNLCNRAVRFIAARDQKNTFTFCSLQSEEGARQVARLGLTRSAGNSIIVLDGDTAWQKSDAVIEIACRLGGAWRLAVAFRVMPRFVRDALYDGVARNRYRWFGKNEACPIPKNAGQPIQY